MTEEPAIESLASRAAQLNWEVETHSFTRNDGSVTRHLTVQWPNGLGRRAITYNEVAASPLMGIDIKNLAFLGDYDAILNKKAGTIEARISSLGVMPLSRARLMNITRLPGVEVFDDAVADGDSEDYDWPRPPEKWRLIVSQGTVVLELSPLTEETAAVLGVHRLTSGSVSLKISGLGTTWHDDALGGLETIGNAFLLDLDLKYDVSYGLFSRRAGAMSKPKARSAPTQPSFPSNKYQAEPLALYQYGRSAQGLPLLEFLAFYQAIEYFFPIYARNDLLGRLRTTLNDPRFDARDDACLGRVLSLAAPVGRGLGSEREQLRATVRGCAEAEELRSLVESTERMTEHFCAKKQAIQGVSKIQLDAAAVDLRDQLADRIYAIRCRIVHTKQDGGDAGVNLLLPSSREARSLAPDVALVRFVAEKVLVARATALRT